MAIAVLKTHYGETTVNYGINKNEILSEDPKITLKISILKSLN